MDLRDGAELSLAVLVGLARCDGGPGSTLPAGTYGVRAGISRNEGPAEVLAPEVPIVVTSG